MIKHDLYCPKCGCTGKPLAAGTLWITVILLFFWIIPGLIYECWRLSPAQLRCRTCGANGLIPTHSPKARQ